MTIADDKPLEFVDLPDFWKRVRGAGNRFLGLDYDGTLAPFQVDRMKALPLPGVLPALEAIMKETATEVGIVSGRPIAELRILLGDFQPDLLIGSHGFEMAERNGDVQTAGNAARVSPFLDKAFQAVSQVVDDEKRLERKIASVALHTRGVEPQPARKMESIAWTHWLALADQEPSLEVRGFNGGVEIRARGRNKGVALLEVLRRREANTLAVYIGDDDTDEDGFKALKARGNGYGLRVGDQQTPTSADGCLPDCETVLRLLKTWLWNSEGEGT
jgi:trehalose 6-phosphate phosphatase